MTSPQTFIIGLDAFDRELTETLLAEGELPNIRKLLASGINGKVRNPQWFEPGASWLDFYYGVPLDTHGQPDGMLRFDGSTYRKRLLNYEELAGKAFWKIASDAGKRVVVVDAPYALLEPEINGIQVTDWLSHVFRTSNISTNPESLGRAIVQQFGDSPFDRDSGCPANWIVLETAEQITAFRDQLLKRSARKAAYCRQVIGEEPWDLFFAVFQEAHEIGHMAWHLHDESHARYDPAMVKKVGDPVRDVYIATDKAIGQLLEVIPKEANILLYSNIGMGTEISATDFFDAILQRLGQAYASLNAGAASDGSHSDKPSLISQLYALLIPGYFRELLSKTALMRRRYTNYHAKMRRSRKFFELAAHHAVGGVRINLVGREESGVVGIGGEYNDLCRQLMADLSEITNTETGRPLARRIMLSSDIYAGEVSQVLPDILVEWDKTGPIRQVHSDKIGTLNNSSDRNRTGDHINKAGFFIARMPDRAVQKLEQEVEAMDFMPTICSLLGVPFNAEGKVIPELTR